ncbi:MAG: ferrous iron transport protein A [Bdellovibrionales bacterium]|nr:ferrous iron transport protein A [Bdellovibrionales bacterium]
MKNTDFGHTLSDKKKNVVLRIKDIIGSDVIRTRLYELGILPGQTMTIVTQMPMGGPFIIEINQTRIALRPEEIQCIQTL